jgi:hypothetical protein
MDKSGHAEKKENNATDATRRIIKGVIDVIRGNKPTNQNQVYRMKGLLIVAGLAGAAFYLSKQFRKPDEIRKTAAAVRKGVDIFKEEFNKPTSGKPETFTENTPVDPLITEEEIKEKK